MRGARFADWAGTPYGDPLTGSPTVSGIGPPGPVQRRPAVGSLLQPGPEARRTGRSARHARPTPVPWDTSAPLPRPDSASCAASSGFVGPVGPARFGPCPGVIPFVESLGPPVFPPTRSLQSGGSQSGCPPG